MKSRLVGMIALIALVVASCGGTTPEAGGPSEGIQVHGDWTIDVYNADGSLHQRIEFSNALQFGGEQTLNRLMGGQVSPSGLWKIRFGARTGSTVCPSQTSGQCVIAPITADNGPTGDGDVTLSGSTMVEADGTIDYVETRMGTCLSGSSRFLGMTP